MGLDRFGAFAGEEPYSREQPLHSPAAPTRLIRPSHPALFSILRTLRALFQTKSITLDNEEDLENWLNNFFKARYGDFW